MISQPMMGRTNEELRKERESLVKELEKQNYKVLDTVFDDAPSDIDEAIYYLAKSIEFVGKADIIVFMKGWEKARGCKIEHQVAVDYGKKVVYCN